MHMQVYVYNLYTVVYFGVSIVVLLTVWLYQPTSIVIIQLESNRCILAWFTSTSSIYTESTRWTNETRDIRLLDGTEGNTTSILGKYYIIINNKQQTLHNKMSAYMCYSLIDKQISTPQQNILKYVCYKCIHKQ